MSVFLRWGIFGILGVAALMYAYNASKRMAERHAQAPPVAETAGRAAPAASEPPVPADESPVVSRVPEQAPPAPAHCEVELAVAQRAIEARKSGEPLDRVLRIQQIAFEESAARRARLEAVATRYFNYESEFAPETLRMAVISDCVRSSP